jgi:hypothetical protein
MATFLDIFIDSLTEIGQLGTGRSPSSEQTQQCLRVVNRMLDKWSIQRLMLFTVAVRQFALTPNVQDYTLGPTGSLGAGAQTRPNFVEAAQVTPPGSSLYLGLNILDQIKWGAIRDKGATCSANGVPQDLWPEYTFPNVGLHFWTIPSNATALYLKTWEALPKAVTIFDVLNFPPGYEEAIQHNLAMELSPFYDIQPSQTTMLLAGEGIAKIQAINAQGLGPGGLGESQTLQPPNLGNPTVTATPPAQPGG